MWEYLFQVIDLHMQLRNYKKVEKWFKNKLGDVKAKRRLEKAVYLFSIGTNDYASLFFINSSTLLTSYSKSEYVSMVIRNITSVVNVSILIWLFFTSDLFRNCHLT